MRKKVEGEGPKLHAMPGSRVTQKELACMMLLRSEIHMGRRELRELASRALSQIQSGALIESGIIPAEVVETQKGGTIRTRLYVDGQPASD